MSSDSPSPLKSVTVRRFLLLLAGCLIVSQFLLVTFFYTQISHVLKNKDRQLITSALSGVKNEMEVSEVKEIISEEPSFLARVLDPNTNKIHFLQKPAEGRQFDFGRLLESIQMPDVSEKPIWTHLLVDADHDYDIVSYLRRDGLVVQIGRNKDERNDIQEIIFKTSFLLFSPILAFALIIGFLGIRRLTYPLRALERGIEFVHFGNFKSRIDLADPLSSNELLRINAAFNEMLDRTQSLITEMKSTTDHIAHDLKTPLTRFRLMAEKTLMAPESDDTVATVAHCKDALGSAIESSNEMIYLIDTILDISSIRSGARMAKSKKFQSNELLSTCLELYRPIAEDKKIHLHLTNTPSLVGYGDFRLLQRAVTNLIDNAIKFTPESGSIFLSATCSTTLYTITIRDTGNGIPKGQMEKIWDRFYKVDEFSQSGWGLGLNLVQAIVRLHNGQVNVESDIGRGTTFSILIPVRDIDA